MVQLALQPSQVKLQGELASVASHDKGTVQRALVVYKIIYHKYGRIRLQIPRLIKDPEYARRLQGLVKSDNLFLGIRINRTAACAVINYPRELRADVQLRSYLDHLIQLAGDTRVPVLQTSEFTQPPSSAETSFWSRLQMPALATILALVGSSLCIPPAIIGSAIAVAALPVAQRTLEGITQQHRLNADFLDLSAITLATVQGSFIAPSLMIALIQLGETIRDQTARSSKKQTLDLLSSLGHFVWVERSGQKQLVSLEEVRPGDTVIVYPGEQIPVDGSIVRGQATIDEQKLTGESMPVVRSPGQSVYASTLVRSGQLYILAERVGADTRAGSTIQLILDAPIHDTRSENYAAKIADRTVLPILLLGGAVFAATGNVARAASVLTLDLATGIRVSVPTAVLASLTYAARQGILIRSGRALEKLAQVDAIVFDKTGTLTQGDVAIVGVKTVNPSIQESRVLEIAVAAEQRLTHPVAEAIINYGLSQGVSVLPRDRWEYQVGLGVRAEIDGQTVLVGSRRFLLKEGIKLEDFDLGASEINYPTIYVASNGQLLGLIQYTDPLRPESRSALAAIREAIGTEIYLLTGDNQQRANTVAQELSIPLTQVHAEAFPSDKVQVVQSLQERGKTVAFVGDGINDSAALAYADVSVSFRDSSDIARETADVVLMKDDLRHLVAAIAIACNAKEIIHQNTSIVAVPNLSGLALAATVGLNPVVATLINNGSSALAGVNGLRPVLTGQ